MRAVPITVLAGLALLAGTIALAASHSPPTVAGTSAIPPDSGLGETRGPAAICQAGEALPAGTTAIRLLLHTSIAGPRVTVAVLAGSRVLTRGAQGSGWTAGAVTVPVTPISRAVSGATTCFAFARSAWFVNLAGRRTPSAVAARLEGRAMLGRVGIEYLRPGRRSWWSRALSIARQMGLGHAGGGALIPVLVLALIVSLIALSSWLVVREPR